MPPQTMTTQQGGSPAADAVAQMSAAVLDVRAIDLVSPTKDLPKAATPLSARGVPLSLRARCR